ncbi:MAG: hypothetical protein JW932_16320 [Deltaproteobacteria bacterium]|nr:hypothetical protein [Deltaproteobacteria bacterium]
MGSLRAKKAATQDSENTLGVWHVTNQLNMMSSKKSSDTIIAKDETVNEIPISSIP